MKFKDTLSKNLANIADLFELEDSKAFSVWAAQIILDLDEQDAFDALSVEGPNDKGIDLFWVDQPDRRVVIAQCKYSAAGNLNPREKDLTVLLSCTDWLVASPEALEREGRQELVAAAIEYQDAIKKGYTVELWFIYTGNKDENIDKRVRFYTSNPENREKKRSAVHCDLGLLRSLYEETRGEGRRVDEATLEIGESFEVRGAFGKGLVTTIESTEIVDL